MGVDMLRIFMMLTLGLLLACGGAPAAPDPTATSPTADTAPTSASAPTMVSTPQPTSTPQAAAPPADVEVNPGKLTIMVSDLANERFDRAFGAGTGYHYGRIMGGYLISDNEKKEMIPGIASQWDLSNDGLIWTFTIREG